jgi:hypothetical protein
MKLSKELLAWASFDDCCHVEKEDNRITSYHDTNPFDKEEEKRFILERIETLYAAGGAVETINIVPLRQTHPISRSLNEVDWEYSEADCDGLPASERNKFDCSCCC